MESHTFKTDKRFFTSIDFEHKINCVDLLKY